MPREYREYVGVGAVTDLEAIAKAFFGEDEYWKNPTDAIDAARDIRRRLTGFGFVVLPALLGREVER